MRSPLFLFGALLVVVLSAALVAPFFIDWTQYRPQFEAYAERATGRAVTIAGDVSVSLLPAPRIVLADVRVANPRDTVSDRFLQARSVDLELAINPLLKGQIVIASLVIDGAVFELEHMGSGFGNWDFKASDDALFTAEDVAIGSAEIRDSVINLRDGTRDGIAKLTDVNLAFDARSLAGPFSISGTVRHEDVPVDLTINTGKRTADGDLRINVHLTQDGGRGPAYTFDGVHAANDHEPGVEGRLTIVRPVLEEGGVLPFAFNADVKGTLASFSFNNMSLLLDQRDAASEITGALTVDIGETLELTAEFGAGHLDLDALAKQAGMDVADFVPDLSLIDKLPKLFAHLPAELDAVIKMRAGALTVAGETVEAPHFDANYAENVLIVDELSGRVPGRGKLLVSGARYDAGLNDPDLRGAFELTTRDTRGFARWVAPSLAEWLNQRPRALRGGATLAGELVMDGRSLGLSHARLQQRDMLIEGDLVYDPGDRPRIDISASVSSLVLDPFILPGDDTDTDRTALSGEELEAFAGELMTEILPDLTSSIDGRIELDIAELGWQRLRGGPFTLNGETHNGLLSLSRLSVRGFNDMNLSANARISWEDREPSGGIWVELASSRPEGLLDILTLPRDAGISVAEARALLRRAAPLRVGLAVSSSASGTEPRTEVEIDGTLAGVDVMATGVATGSLSTPSDARLDIEGRAQAVSEDAFLALVGLPTAGSGEGHPDIRRQLAGFSIIGVPSAGAAATFDLNLYDAHARAEGVVTWSGDSAETRASVSLDSADGAQLLSALKLEGLVGSGDDAAVALEGSIAVDGDQVAVNGLGGKIGANAVGFSGTIGIAADARTLSGSVTLSTLSFPWLVERGLGTRRDVSEILASGTLETVAVWNSLPFDGFGDSDLVADLFFDVGELAVDADTTIESAAGRLRYANGTVAFEALSGGLYGGALTLDAALVNRGGELSLDARYALADADLGQATQGGDGEALVDGRVSVEGTLAAQGRSPLGLASTLSGDGSFTIEDGVLRGLDPEAFSTALQLAAEPGDYEALVGEVLVRGAMPLAALEGSFAVRDGVARLTPIEFAGVSATGTAAAQVDLAAWQVDAQWTMGLDELPDAPAFSVLHEGDLDAMQRGYDTAALQNYLVVRGLSEGVRRLEELQRREEEELARLEEMERRAEEMARARAQSRYIGARDAARQARRHEMDLPLPEVVSVPDEPADSVAALPDAEETPAAVDDVTTGSTGPQTEPADAPGAGEREEEPARDDAVTSLGEPEALPPPATLPSPPQAPEGTPREEEVTIIELPQEPPATAPDGAGPTEITPGGGSGGQSAGTDQSTPAPLPPVEPLEPALPAPYVRPGRNNPRDNQRQDGLFSDNPADWLR